MIQGLIRGLFVMTLLSATLLRLEGFGQSPVTISSKRLSGCCHEFTVFNPAGNALAVNTLDVKVLAAGDSVERNGIAPNGWNLSYPSVESAKFLTSLQPVQPGDSLTGFRLCFASQSGYIAVGWTAQNGWTLLGDGEVILVCNELCDEIAVSSTIGACCFPVEVRNRNMNQMPIDKLAFKLLTAGASWSPFTQTPGWLKSNPSPDSLIVSTTSAPVPPGDNVGGFVLCTEGTGSDTIRVHWTTMSGSVSLCSDTIALGCRQTQCDSIIQTSIAGCCPTFAIRNANGARRIINGVRFTLVTPNASISGTPSGPWPTRGLSKAVVEFVDVGSPVLPGTILDGFKMCMTSLDDSIVVVQWETLSNDTTVCTDFLSVQCASQCDAVEIEPRSAPGACGYSLTLRNVHTPRSPLTGLEIELLTPDAQFMQASGPWSLTDQTAQRLVFSSTSTPLPAGASLQGFLFSVKPRQGSSLLHLVWRTIQSGVTMCSDTIALNCQFSTNCDSLIVSNTSGCDYDMGFHNLHTPSSLLNGFEVSVSTFGASLSTITPPAGWSIESRTSRTVRFRSSGPGVSPGGRATGFLLTFVPPAGNRPIDILWCTLESGTEVCCDSLTVQCTPVEVRCDSLLVTPEQEACLFSLALRNQHAPASPLNRFRINVTTAGASIDTAIAPPGWMIETKFGSQVIFRDTSGTLATDSTVTGIRIRFRPAAGNPFVRFQWCTFLDGALHCCGDGGVECREETRCDSASATSAEGNCSFEIVLRNSHAPPSSLDAFRLAISPAGASVTAAFAPFGWVVSDSTPSMILFKTQEIPFPSGAVRDSFVVRLAPRPGEGRMTIHWQTEASGAVVCGDSIKVECFSGFTRPDSVTMSADTLSPCCFEFELVNTHQPESLLNSLGVSVLTPGVVVIESRVGSPAGWIQRITGTSVRWDAFPDVLPSGQRRDGFRLCFDNNAISNQDFLVLWQSGRDEVVVSGDTLLVKCDATLRAQSVQESRSPRLLGNFPNPVATETGISFELSEPSYTDLELVDLMGRSVRTIASGFFEMGRHEITIDLSTVPAGLYVVRLKTGKHVLLTTLIKL